MTSGADRTIGKTIAALLACEVALVVVDLWLNIGDAVADESIREMFNVARELSVGNWFSSAQTLGVAITLWLVRLRVAASPTGTRGAARGWAVLAGLFAYVALDDGANLHERLAVLVSDFFAATGTDTDVHAPPVALFGRLLEAFPSYPWMVLFGPFLAALGAFMGVFLWKHLEDRRLLAVAAAGLALYALAQVQDFFEGLETVYDAVTHRFDLDPYTIPHAMRVLEEYLEMLGTTAFLYAFLKHLASLPRDAASARRP